MATTKRTSATRNGCFMTNRFCVEERCRGRLGDEVEFVQIHKKDQRCNGEMKQGYTIAVVMQAEGRYR